MSSMCACKGVELMKFNFVFAGWTRLASPIKKFIALVFFLKIVGYLAPTNTRRCCELRPESNNWRRPSHLPVCWVRSPGWGTAWELCRCLWVHILQCQQSCKNFCPEGPSQGCQWEGAVWTAKTRAGVHSWGYMRSWTRYWQKTKLSVR